MGDSVREIQGTEMGPGGGVTPCWLSPSLDTHTQGAPRLLAGEVVSTTQHVDEVRAVMKHAFTTHFPKKKKLFPLKRFLILDPVNKNNLT